MERNDIIAKVEERDLRELHSILKATFNGNSNYEKIKEQYEQYKNNKDIYVLGYYINDKIVGTLTLNILTLPSGKEATIWALAVKEEYRRLGIAMKLMNRAEEIVKEYKDIKVIWLFSSFHRKGAHELYKKLGYDDNMDKAFIKIVER